MSKEALKLAVSVLKDAQEYKRGHTTFVDAVEELEEALAEQSAQPLPFGVGGGLVAIKTLLSRDPCGHANTAIQMIDAILAEQPAQQDIPDLIAGTLGVSRGTAYDLMREALAEQPAPVQQEPVAGLLVGQDSDGRYVSIAAKAYAYTLPLGEYKLYTSPPAQRKPLTDEELANILPDDDTPMSLGEAFVKFARAIEAKHNIKENT